MQISLSKDMRKGLETKKNTIEHLLDYTGKCYLKEAVNQINKNSSSGPVSSKATAPLKI